jgi:NADH dehydrogenase
VGDLAASLAADGSVLPQVAPVAIQGAEYLGHLIAARLRGEKAERPFVYRDKGSMATIGRHSAVAELPSGLRLGGPIGWIAWLVLHLLMLIGFRNRANVIVNWAWSYVTYDRASRIITGPLEK